MRFDSGRGKIILRFAVIFVSLTLFSQPAASAQGITDRDVLEFAHSHLREFLRSVVNADDVLRIILQDNYGTSGIPFRTWISLILAGNEAQRLLSAGRQVEAARVAVQTQINFGMSQFASALGLSSTWAVAQLGLRPVVVSLDRFMQVTNEDGMQAQIDCYFKARALTPIPETHQSILARNSLSQDVTFDGLGWFIEVRGVPCRRGLARHPSLFNAPQTMATAEWLWRISQSQSEFQVQRGAIVEALRAALASSLPSVSSPTILGLLQQNPYPNRVGDLITPVAVHERGAYYGAATPAARRLLREARSYWLYRSGNLIGTLRVSDITDPRSSGEPTGAVFGKATWRGNPPSYDDLVFKRVVALSRSIPQPFFWAETRLTPLQVRSLTRILDTLSARARKLWERQVGRAASFTLGKREPLTLTVTDINRDGRPEVFARMSWFAGTPCSGTEANVFAKWDTKWEVIKQSTYMSQCQDRETAGEDKFDVFPVDMDGDGIAELILTEGRWENWTRFIYRLSAGRLVKVLELGSFGR